MKIKILFLFFLINLLAFTGAAQRATTSVNYTTAAIPSSCVASKTTSLLFKSGEGLFKCVAGFYEPIGAIQQTITSGSELASAITTANQNPLVQYDFTSRANLVIGGLVTVPTNVEIDLIASGAFEKFASGEITFLGEGITQKTANRKKVVFKNFGENDVRWIGADYAEVVNVEIFDSPTNKFNERWERASKALNGKQTTIKVNKSGDIVAQIRIRQGQTLFICNARIKDVMPPTFETVNPDTPQASVQPFAKNVAPVVIEDDTTVDGCNNRKFGFVERSPVSRVESGVTINDYTNAHTPIIRASGVVQDNAYNFNRPNRNITVKNTGFFGDHRILGADPASGTAVHLGNVKGSLVENNYFEGTHGFHIGVGGFTDTTNLPNGTVDTNGTLVTWKTGVQFPSFLVNETVRISGIEYDVVTVNSPTSLTINLSAGTQTAVPIRTVFFAQDGKILNNTIRYPVTQSIYGLTFRRLEVAGNSIYDLGSLLSPQSSMFDFEPNVNDDIGEFLDLHHNMVDGTNAKENFKCITVQTGGAIPPMRFVKVHHNTCIGGYIENDTIISTQKMVGGIDFNGLELSTINNNLIVMAMQIGIQGTNFHKVTVTNNDVYDSGQVKGAIVFSNGYESIVSNNNLPTLNAILLGNKNIDEELINNAVVTADGSATITRGNGAGMFFHFLKGRQVKIAGQTRVILSVTNYQVLVLDGVIPAGTYTLTMPKNKITYLNNDAQINLLTDTESLVQKLERVFDTAAATSGSGAGATAASPTLLREIRVPPSNSKRGLFSLGDTVNFDLFGKFGATGSADKRLVIKIEGTDIGAITLLDTGNLTSSGEGWAVKITAVAISPNIQKYIVTLTTAGISKTTYTQTTTFSYGSYRVNVYGSGSLANDVSLEYAKSWS